MQQGRGAGRCLQAGKPWGLGGAPTTDGEMQKGTPMCRSWEQDAASPREPEQETLAAELSWTWAVVP